MDASKTIRPEDEQFLRRAMDLARNGWGRVHPNPLVGCVVVRDGEVVGEGWHREFGGPHAEAEALDVAGERARDATAYVSLEPCRHEGKTPPCTKILLERGVARVVYGAADPGEASGGGADELRAAGVEVEGPFLDPARARWENPLFFHRSDDRPWLALKLAVSLDCRISSEAGSRTQLSGPEATAEVHRLRAGFSGILIGARTAKIDDPRLTPRGSIQPRVPPCRIVLDTTGTLSPDMRLFRDGEGEVWVLTGSEAGGEWRQRMEAVGARVLNVAARSDGRLSLPDALRVVRREGLTSILCEGGGVLSSELLRANLVDRLHLVIAPRFLGWDGVPAFPGLPGIPASGMSEDRTGVWRTWHPGEPPKSFGRDVWVSLEPDAG